MKFICLNNKLELPVIGLGTFPLNGRSLIKAVLHAHNNCGYRYFDTSAAYFNEECLGLATKHIVSKGLERPIISTKLSNTSQRQNKVKEGFFASLKKLGIDKVDIYLMHWPYPEKYLESWKEMEYLYKKGFIGAIGVCNFHKHHLEKLLEIAEIVPAINQIELHPLLSQIQLRDYCNNKGIRVQAYSPIARNNSKLVKNEALIGIAKRYSKSVPQIILRWHTQNGIVAIPKSGNRNRIKENIEIFDFELAEHDMRQIDMLNEEYRVRYNPDTADYINVLKA